ncbi:unnamed protein product, partial [Coregonus sp. 'balchen']
KRMMTASSLLSALVVATCAALLPFSAAQASCSARCGEPFARGQPCLCDASCLAHDECCKDFEALCTSGKTDAITMSLLWSISSHAGDSCSGRCGESFRRGRLCECDPGCVHYDTCCRDYQNHCDATTIPTPTQRIKQDAKKKPTAPAKNKSSSKTELTSPTFPKKPSNSKSEEGSQDQSKPTYPSPSDLFPETQYYDTNSPYPGSSSSKSQSDISPFSEDPASPLKPGFYLLTDSFNGPSSTAPDTVMDALSDAATSLLEDISPILPTPMAATPFALPSLIGQLPGAAKFPSSGSPWPSQGGPMASNAGPGDPSSGAPLLPTLADITKALGLNNPITLADIAKALGVNTPNDPITLANIAKALGFNNSNDPNPPQNHNNPSSLADIAKVMGLNSPNDPITLANIAKALGSLADIAKALGLNSPNYPITLANIAKALGLNDPNIPKTPQYSNEPITLADIAKALGLKTPNSPITLEDIAKALGLKKNKDPITLANIAKVLGLNDPSTLADIAKALGFKYPNDPKPPQSPNSLADIAKALGLNSPNDPITLANIAKTLGLNNPNKPINLADIAKAMGLNDPSTLADLAEALGVKNPNKPITLADIAKALGLNNPKPPQNPNTLADIAKALGLNDPNKPITLADIAKALGLNDPSTLAGIVKALGVKNPNDPKKPQNLNSPNILADIAKALGLNDPNKPITLADIAKALEVNNPKKHNKGLPDANSNPDLCSDLPINGLTTLANGTILIFKGHFFWTMDPSTKALGPARNITEELGIPSPIDSAFTRTNCQGKSYIIKGDGYWRMDNGKMEPGYPKSVASGFDGLTGTITAALSVPATRRRPESVYFFKKGGTMQKYSYPAGSSPVCGKKSKSSAKKRHARQAEVPLYFNIKISGDLPALAKPDNPDPSQNSIKNWLKCA